MQACFFMPSGVVRGHYPLKKETGGRKVDISAVTTLIAALAAVSGILLGWIGRTKAFKDEVAKEATADASLQTDVSYIKNGIVDIRVDIREIGKRTDGLNERLTRVEESAKQAHKRLDRLGEN